MAKINELQLSKELIRFPSVTPKDAGAIKFLSKKFSTNRFKIFLSLSDEKDYSIAYVILNKK